MADWLVNHAQGWFKVSGDESRVKSIVIEQSAKQVPLVNLQMSLQEALLHAASEYVSGRARELVYTPRQLVGPEKEIESWNADEDDEILSRLIDSQNSLVAQAQLSYRPTNIVPTHTFEQQGLSDCDFSRTNTRSDLFSEVRLEYVAGVLTQVGFDADWFAASSVEEINLQIKHELETYALQAEQVWSLCEQFECVAASALLAAKKYHPAFGK